MSTKVTEDWRLERQFKKVPGVIDVVSFGGESKEFHVELDPNKLVAFNVSISQVLAALSNSNANVGANYLELGVQSYNVRGIGLFKDTEDIAHVAVASKNGTPIYLKQLGQVNIGAKVPMGRVGKDEQDDIVQGVVLMRRGEQSLPTLARVRQKVEQLNHGGLPKGRRIVPHDDRTNLINLTTHTVTHVATTAMPAVVQLAVTAQPGVAQPVPADPAPATHHAFQTPALPRQFKRPMMGVGAGILMDAQGHILTNHHVIQGATTITALLADKRTYPAQVIGVDVKTDLAVLKIDTPEPLPRATFGDSDTVEVGTWVVAIGHPQGLVETVTHGIISGKHRHGLSEANGYEDFLQTDAAMNPGNSGGPLLNLRAEVIGVNTTIVSQTGGFEGLGFAIPSNIALAVARALIASGKVERA